MEIKNNICGIKESKNIYKVDSCKNQSWKHLIHLVLTLPAAPTSSCSHSGYKTADLCQRNCGKYLFILHELTYVKLWCVLKTSKRRWKSIQKGIKISVMCYSLHPGAQAGYPNSRSDIYTLQLLNKNVTRCRFSRKIKSQHFFHN